MDEPREYTQQEIRDQFVAFIAEQIDHWTTSSAYAELPPRERLTRCLISILAVIDDGGSSLPPFLLAPACTGQSAVLTYDRPYYADQGRNWYPDNPPYAVKGNIAEFLAQALRERCLPD